MKKIILLILTVILFCVLVPASAQAPERRLTLMIYMCGSNLESSYGSASADIQEMLAAAPGLDGATVLVMTGGSTSWATGYDAGQTQITELGKRGMRVVWRSDALNMGAPETLTQLLRFGVTQYPAQDYALIMWNHGGGPLEGVCWDELFSMDRLSLSELTGAIAAAGMPQKLSWIGFDACLMSSIEVACALAPYAEYMIASQETEPAHGWNYAFLNGLGRDVSGAETGRRIVDCYFEGREQTRDVLTLACLDLSQAYVVRDALDTFFAGAGNMNSAMYSSLSGVRMNAVGFGKGIKAFGDDGYDLVDLRDLLARLSGVLPDAEPAAAALDALVCYSRSNIADAGGVSIYHPYMNKNKYITHWKNGYASLDFSPAYASYVHQFGAWLTGDALVEWTHLTPVSTGFNAAGKEELALQLSPAQAGEFSSARLVIFKQNVANNNTYSLIGVVPAQMDENGLVTAAADWRCLFARTEDGVLHGPVSYELTSDGRQVARHVFYDPLGSGFYKDTVYTVYLLEPQPDSSDAKVVQIRVHDDVTDTYTNRISIEGQQFERVHLYEYDYMLPELTEDGVLPDFAAWPRNSEWFSEYYWDATQEWHFVFQDDLETNQDLIAVFAVTDSQQNTYCSMPIKLHNAQQMPFATLTGQVELDQLSVTLDGNVSYVSDKPGLILNFNFTNPTDTDAKIYIKSVTLNGTRLVRSPSNYSDNPYSANSTETCTCFIPACALVGLEDIHSIEVSFSHYPNASTYDSVIQSATFLVTGCNVKNVAVPSDFLAETEQNGIVWKVLEIKPSVISGYEITMYVENNTAAPLNLRGELLLNNLQTDSTLSSNEIPAGCSSIETMYVYNDVFTEDLAVDYIVASAHSQQSYGMTEIQSITIYLSSYQNFTDISTHAATLTLTTPYILETPRDANSDQFTSIYRLSPEDIRTPDQLATLISNNRFTIKLERVVVMGQKFYLCLHVTNHTGSTLDLAYEDFVISGTAYERNPLVPQTMPNVTHIYCVGIGYSAYSGEAFADPTFTGVSLKIRDVATGRKYPVTITLDAPVEFGSEAAIMLPAERLSFSTGNTVTPTPAPTPAPTPTPRPYLPSGNSSGFFADQVIMPENAQQYSRTFSLPLTQEQQEQFAGGMMVLVRQADDGCLRVVHYQAAHLQEDGRLTATASGLVLCADDLQAFPINTLQRGTEEHAFVISNAFTIHPTGWLPDSYELISPVIEDLNITVDLEANTAVVSKCSFKKSLPEDLSLINQMTFPTYDILCDITQPDLPHIATYDTQIHDIWEYPCLIQDQLLPVQLCLRPITPEDHLYVVFAIKNQDGTGYTTVVSPYFPAEE